jgi:hypothetical protein
VSSTSNGRLIDRRGPAWFDFARRVALFVLGFYTICYALVTTGHDVAFLVTGLILTSTIPIEDALRALTRQEARTMPETPDRPDDETAADDTTADDDAGAEILDAGDGDETEPKHALI